MSALLSLAATPTFATLALLSGLPGGEGCGARAAGDMGVMYALMALFHLPAWFRTLARQSWLRQGSDCGNPASD